MLPLLIVAAHRATAEMPSCTRHRTIWPVRPDEMIQICFLKTPATVRKSNRLARCLGWTVFAGIFFRSAILKLILRPSLLGSLGFDFFTFAINLERRCSSRHRGDAILYQASDNLARQA
ncbi:uncharacterized protein LOC120285759 [Drosophila simulans]|uniref:uncharacterized protein LOC120285759 n=1 Tax=Drosophila simulans TaxID=7240 RepID=UPI00192CF4EC|nr:uncharacterized protein LOC120285759 [Drosophila simulans]